MKCICGSASFEATRGGGPSFGETDGVKGSFKDDQLKRLFHGNEMVQLQSH